MNHSDSLDQLAPALVAFQAAVPTVPKTKTGKIMGQGKNGPYEYSYSYADLDEAVKTAQPHLTANGLAVTQLPTTIDGKPGLSTMVLHASGQWVEDAAELMLAKEDPQGQGSGITYMRRYAYCAGLGIVADIDDDGAAATHRSNEHRWSEQSGGASGPFSSTRTPDASSSDLATTRQLNLIRSMLARHQITADDDVTVAVSGYVARPVNDLHELSKADASRVIDLLKETAA